MKCPYCFNKPNMVKKSHGHDNWWECPQCRRTVGKKAEPEQKDETDDNASDI